MVFVYVLHSKVADKYYVGMTTNLLKRLAEHNAGRSKFTSGYGPWVVVYFEEVEDYKAGRIREKYLKTAAGKKFVMKKLEEGSQGSLPA
jgi:putative endonuclease